jgi:single-strand DNA-binding protein
MNLNKAMIIGNLTKDPEIRQTGSGLPVASFSVATNMVWKDAAGQKQEKVEFHNIVAWKNLADICGRFLKKGSKVYIEGRLQTRDWAGKDGVKRYTTEIVAENMIMLDSRGSAGAPYSGPATYPNQNQANQSNQSNDITYDNIPTINADAPADEEISVENIPF